MLDDHHVGIHVTVDTVLHASVLVALKGALCHAASDALLEADGVEFVDGYDIVLACVKGNVCMRQSFVVSSACMHHSRSRHTGLDLRLLGLADDELVEFLLVFGTEVLQALLGFGGDLELVHG